MREQHASRGTLTRKIRRLPGRVAFAIMPPRLSSRERAIVGFTGTGHEAAWRCLGETSDNGPRPFSSSRHLMPSVSAPPDDEAGPSARRSQAAPDARLWRRARLWAPDGAPGYRGTTVRNADRRSAATGVDTGSVRNSGSPRERGRAWQRSRIRARCSPPRRALPPLARSAVRNPTVRSLSSPRIARIRALAVRISCAAAFLAGGLDLGRL